MHDNLLDNGLQEDRRRLETEVEARLGEKDAELKQKEELQTLRVRNWMETLTMVHA